MLRYIISLLLACFISFSLQAETWTLFIYADSSDQLSDVAIKNITDALSAESRDHLTITVQLHAYGSVSYRYIIKNHALVFVQEVNVLDDDIQNFVDAAQWAFSTYPSDKTMMLCWNHGFGALEPVFNISTQKWEAEPDILSSGNKLDLDEIIESSAGMCQLRSFDITRMNHRGYMFRLESRTYLTNTDLVYALDQITSNLGRKIDIIAFDTCMGAMVENCYHCASFAHYLVGVQSCASKDGFNYKGLGEVFSEPQKTTADIAASWVKTFDDYYKDNLSSDIYTLSAIDLSKISAIKNQLDALMPLVNGAVAVHGEKAIRKALRVARAGCYGLCLFPMYVDLSEALMGWRQQLELIEQPSEALATLQKALDGVCTSITQSLVGHCCGYALKGRAHGISMYLPVNHLDSSYATTPFGQESCWGDVIRFSVG